MPKIKDIAKIWEQWSLIKDDLEALGYQSGAISVDEFLADQRDAFFTTCPECNQHCNCSGFNKARSYRSYVVCQSCDIAYRFS